MRERILQVHPTRRCNLRCRHCYSDSGPGVREELPLDLLERAVADAAAEGYDVLCVSGGEPFLYGHLPALLGAARRAGMRTTVTSNGTRLAGGRLRLVADRIDLLALSLDGVPASHDRIRGPGAFEALARGIEEARSVGIRFGFIFTLTQFNLDELEWAIRFAAEQGASLFQVHPLAAEGRVCTDDELGRSLPDSFECAMAVAVAARARSAAIASPALQVDVAPISSVVDTLLASCRVSIEAPPRRLADLVSPLVVEASGLVVPHQSGLHRFALGSLSERSLRDLGNDFRAGGARRYAAFLASVAEGMDESEAGDPYSRLAARARQEVVVRAAPDLEMEV